MTEPHSTHILLVDDTEANRYTLGRHLRRAGYEVWEAGTGEEGLRLADQEPSLIILDVKLPDVLGYDVCRQLRQNPRTSTIPILQISANFRMSSDRVKGLEAGADGYLTGPVEPDELLANVQMLLRLRDTTQHLQQRNQRLALLSETMRDLLTARAPENILRTAFERVLRLLPVDTYFYFLVDEAGEALRLQASAGVPDEFLPGMQRLPLGYGACGGVARAGLPRVVSHLQDSTAPDFQFARRIGLRAYVGQPLQVGDRCLGTLAFASRTVDEFTPEDLDFLGTLAHHVALAVERARAAELLRESEKKFRAVFEQAAVGMGRVRFSDARWIDVNTAFCRMLGYTAEEFRATPWPQITHPEDLTLDLEPFQRMAAGELDRYTVEKRFRHKDGHHLWARLTLSLVRDPQGRADYEVAVIEDITERKQAEEALRTSEERLRATFDHAGVGIVEVEGDDHFIAVNQRACEILQRSREQLLTMNVHELTWPEDRSLSDRINAELHAHGHGRVDYEKRYLRGDGSPVWVHATISPVRDGAGRWMRSITTIEDISERKQAEQALQQLNQQLQVMVAERSALAEQRAGQLRLLAGELSRAEQNERDRLAHVLHDHLQPLLLAARMKLDMVAESTDDGDRKAVIESAEILTQGLDLSRSLSVELSPPVLKQSGLGPALEWLKTWIKTQHGIEVELLLASGVEILDQATRLLCFQAVRELLLNVVKHAGVTRARVTVERNEQMLVIAVGDAGKGFDAAHRHTNLGTETQSFGLSTVESRLGMIGGQLQIESAPGQGTTATVFVPIEPAPSVETTTSPEAAVPSQAVAVGATETTRPLRKGEHIRVLLADDHRVLRESLAGVLRLQPDLEIVAEAEDGQSALELTRQFRPDVVVMDVSMPRLDGMQATRCIRREMPQVCVIGLSMHEPAEKAKAMLQAGASDYLAKAGPVRPLVDAIRRCARRRLDEPAKRSRTGVAPPTRRSRRR